jgi:hypothetical protein
VLRRNFLSALTQLIGLAAFPVPSRAATAPSRILLQTSPVAGFQYHAGESVWPLLAPGAALALVREADNVHDGKAVRVEWNGLKLGYVPRAQNHTLAQLLDRGHELEGRIEALRVSRNPWERVRFAVLLRV